jgi:hypothetical protein
LKKYTKDSTLSEILENPKAPEVLDKYNVPCLTCPMMAMEMEELTLGGICEKYHIDEGALLEELNKNN